MTVTGGAKLAGVIGWPVAHSRSPLLHGYWLARYAIDGAYVPLPVRPEALERALRALPLLGFRGVNVTLPHKEAALAAVDRVDDAARRVGAVNTIVVGNDGALIGRNTDGFGFIESLRDGAPDLDLSAGPAVVLGAGGAARAVAAALLDAGVPGLCLLNRTPARAERVARDLDGRCVVRPLAEAPAALPGAALLVNATSMGMAGQPALALELGTLPVGAVVMDLVYEPLETGLLAAARRRGNPAVDGLGMLLHQARPGFEAWFGLAPAVTPELRAAVLGGAAAAPP